jgi:predicted metalloendopeptidase
MEVELKIAKRWKMASHAMLVSALNVCGSRLIVAGLCTALALSAQAEPPVAEPTFPLGVDIAGMDRSVAPGVNFFDYANGTWLRTNEIPADRKSYGYWDVVQELVERRVADLIQHAAERDPTGGSPGRKISDYFASFMQEDRIEALGLRPLQPILKRIKEISNRRSLATFLGGTLRADVDVLNDTEVYTDNLFGLWVAQDLDHPDRYVPFLLQGGLGMPDRSYYLDVSAGMADIRTKYATHVAEMLKLIGFSDTVARAARIVDLESRIATVHSSREATEDVQKGNNHWLRREFETRAPGLDWNVFFAAAEFPKTQQDFVVWQPSAVTGISALVASQPLATWKDYLALHAVEHRAAFLPKAVVEANFAFHGTILDGTPELRVRWRRAIDVTNHALGDAVGKLYAERYFSAAAKVRIEEMVDQLRTAFSRRIDLLEWMAPETRESAKAKLRTLKVGVGYPDQWRDYTGLDVVMGDAFGNAERAAKFEYHYHLAKLGRPVDRGEWVMNPQTVNAVNLPAMNALNFPAAMLQPPYFSLDSDPAQNYGSIGATIGHEISHSFDDQGATFDATGRLRNWWTKEDLAHFRAAGAQLVRQFDAYHPLPDLAVNGQLTLSENIADLGGLLAAHDAYRLEVRGRPDAMTDGFTGEQRFYLSYAQSWREKYREAALRKAVLTNGHAPDEYRASTARNIDGWYAAFDIQAGQPLYLAPADRVRIW